MTEQLVRLSQHAALLALLLLSPALLAQRVEAPARTAPAAELCARAEQMAKTGDLVEAEAACRSALRAYEDQTAGQAVAVPNALGACHARNQLASLLLTMGKVAEARTLLATALPIVRQAIGQYPQEPSFRLELSEYHHVVAALGLATLRIDEGLAGQRERITILQALVKDCPRRAEFRKYLASALLEHGSTLMDLAQQPEGDAMLEQAMLTARQFAKDFPEAPEAVESIVMTASYQAVTAKALGRYARAAGQLREAIRLANGLQSTQPSRPDLWSNLPLLYQQLGDCLTRLNDAAGAQVAQREATDAAATLAKTNEVKKSVATNVDALSPASPSAELERARKEADDRTRAHPEVPEYRRTLARLEKLLGQQLANNGSAQDAREHLARSRDLYASLVKDFPDLPQYRESAATALVLCGMAEELGKEPGVGDPLIKQGLDQLEKLANDHPTHPKLRHELGQLYVRLLLLKESQRAEQPMNDYLTATLRVMQKLATDYPRDAAFRRDLAQTSVSLGERLANWDEPRAEALLRAGVQHWSEVVTAFPTVEEFRGAHGQACSKLGSFLARHEKGKEAEQAYAEAVRIDEQLTKDCPRDPQNAVALAADSFLLGVLRENQRDLPAALTCYTRTVAALETALRSQPEQREWLVRLQAAQRQRAFVLLGMQRVPEYEAALQAAAAVDARLDEPARRK